MRILIILSIMAISCDKNQVLNVPDDFDCNCQESSYCAPVEQGDETPIKLSLTSVSGNIITNGDFASASGWTVGADWSISGGKANYSGTIPATAISRDVDTILTAGYYLVKIDVTIIEAQNLSLAVQLGGQTISTIGGLIGGGFLSQTYYLYGYINPASNSLSIAGSNYDCQVDNVEVYLLSSVEFEIKDCNTDTVYYTETDNASVVYYENTTIATGDDYLEVLIPYAIVTLDWSAYTLANGCYCVCFKDSGLIGYEFVRNGTFASSSFWTINNSGVVGWVITGGKIVRNEAETGGELDSFEQELSVPLGDLCYLLRFDIEAPSNWSFAIYYDTATTSDNVLANIAGSGNDSVEISIDSAATLIKFSATGAFDSSIDNISIKVDPECEECNTTKCVSLQTSWDAFTASRGMCNILVEGSNANSAYGFPAGYAFKGRIFGNIRNGQGREILLEAYKDLSGLKTLQYMDREKIKELQVFQVPQYVHDWLELALSSQTVTLTINGVSKNFIKVQGDYTPNWRKRSVDAPVIVEIQETQQLPYNARNS